LAMKMELLDNSLANARQNLAQNSFSGVVASLQNASNILSQIWSARLDCIPQPMIAVTVEQGVQVEAVEKEFLIKKSLPAEARINALIGEAQNILNGNGGNFTARIDGCQNIFKKINNEFSGIYDQSIRLGLQEKIEKISVGLGRLNKERYQAYQANATEKCQDAFKKYKKWKVVSEKDAIDVFNEFKLATLKQELLIPEVAAIYNDILQKLYAEMSWQKRAEWEKTCATGEKLTLENL
jgi:hypothetical protein